MFIQATTPRPVFDAAKHPAHIYIHTLAKVGTSTGQVFFNATKDPEHGTRQGKAIEPENAYVIEGEDGFEALEYVIPFWDLFKQKESTKQLTYDGMPISEQTGVRAASVELVRYCTAGFGITVKSAFRANPREYEEHTLAMTIVCPATGGGIIRIAGVGFDLNNASFDPWAPNPNPRKNLEFEQMYSRNHKLLSSASMDRRAARIAAAEASMKAEGHVLPEKKTKLLGRG